MLVGFTILSSTFLLTPSAHDVISSLPTQQNSSAILLPRSIRLPRVIHRGSVPKSLSMLVEAISGKRSTTDGEPEGQKGRRKHIKQQPGATKDDVTMGGMSSGQKDPPRAPTRARTRSYTTPSSRRSAYSLSKCGKSEAQSSCAG